MPEYKIVDKLYPIIDEFQCPDYRCKDCKYFRFVSPKNPHGCTHRFDHAIMEYAHPWFVNVPEERGYPCSDFKPDGSYPAALPYWHGFEHWREWMNKQNREDDPRPQDMIDRLNQNVIPYIAFEFKGDKEEARYRVALENYIYGTMFDGNKLKAFEKHYYKRTREGFGYKLVKEKIDGVVVDDIGKEKKNV